MSCAALQVCKKQHKDWYFCQRSVSHIEDARMPMEVLTATVRLGDPRHVAEKLSKFGKMGGVAHFKALAALADLATSADQRTKAKVS